MLAYIIRRLFQSLLVMFFVAFIAFSMFNYVGDPIHQMVGQDTSFEEREKLREDLGLNDPAPVQFMRFVFNAARGEFGLSYQHKRPVAQLIQGALPGHHGAGPYSRLNIANGRGGASWGLYRSSPHRLAKPPGHDLVFGRRILAHLPGRYNSDISYSRSSWAGCPRFGRGEVVQIWAFGAPTVLTVSRALNPSSCPPIPWACSR
jgi:hypothetical protein